MSSEREFNAPSVEEAVEKAASEIGVQPREVSYEILDEGSSGFLGIGVRDSRILVSMEQSSSEVAFAESKDVVEESDSTEAETVAEASAQDVENQPSFDQTELSPEREIASDELLSAVREHVQNLVSATGLGGEVSVRDDKDHVHVEIDSPESGLLIGQKGETIDSLQYLVNVAIYRDRAFQKKIMLDVGGYRERRIKAVQGMALRASKRVARAGKAVELPSMSSSERRAVHTYLKDDPRVTTASEGKDEDRKITIYPA